MLNCERQNYHHSKLPKIGEILYVAGLRADPDNLKKCVVVAYPLNDSADYHYSRGIHTCYVRILATGQIRRIACQWLIDDFDRFEYLYLINTLQSGF